MHSRIIVSLALAGTLALVGCGSELATEQVTERAAVATHAAAQNTPDIPAFTLDVSGDTPVEMPPGEVTYQSVDASTVRSVAIPAHRVLLLTREDEGQRYELRLWFPAELDAGTHEISRGAFDPRLSPVAAELVAYPVEDGRDGAEAVRYNDTVEGNLTLDEAATNRVSGHFNFMAETTRLVDGEETVVTIMAAGTFEDVELSGSADAQSTAEATDAAAP